MFEQNEGDPAEKEDRRFDFRGPRKKIYGSCRTDDQDDSNDKQNVANSQKTRVKECQDPKKKKTTPAAVDTTPYSAVRKKMFR